jgi:hypothetical protein
MTPYLAALAGVVVAAFVARIDLIARLGSTMTIRRLLIRYAAVHVGLVATGVPLAAAHVHANGHSWWRVLLAAVTVYVFAGVLAAVDYARLCRADRAAPLDRDDAITMALLVVVPIPLMVVTLRRLPPAGARWVVRP